MVADFFISDFLGCMLTEEPHIVTKRFFETTVKYLNECIDSAEDKAALLNHVTSELTSQNSQINPVRFARQFLPKNHQDQYVDFIADHGAITNGFVKDISLIEKRLKKVFYEFVSGITVIGAKESLDEKAKVSDGEDGLTHISISDELRKVASK